MQIRSQASLLTGVLATLCSWAVLLLAIGGTGASRAVSVGLDTLIVEHWPALVLATLTAAAVAASVRSEAWAPLAILVVVLGMNAIAAVAVLPVLIGELTPMDAPVTFAAMSALGLQPLGALAGAAAHHAVASRVGPPNRPAQPRRYH